jgi:Z1 domain
MIIIIEIQRRCLTGVGVMASEFNIPLEAAVDILRMLVIKHKSFDEAIKNFNIPIPKATLDLAVEELSRLIGQIYDTPPTGMVGTAKHRWYTGPDENSKQWNKFRARLSDANWDEDSIAGVDFNSTRILGRTVAPTPDNDTPESGRGLVIGYVQSGKTTSFMSVTSKAADAGYRLIIVLSGVTNNLRAQTQTAFNDFVAPENDPDWHWLTDENNDFKIVGNATNLLKSKQLIAVVKKNGTVLKRLLKWLATASDEARKHTPMLVIDDEADQATPNTARDEKRRSVVNQRVIDLLSPDLVPVNSYLAYTATPFANLLLDPNIPDDIFPRDFIIALPHGQGYFGPEKLFGRDPLDEDDQEAQVGLDIIRNLPSDEIEKLGRAANPNAHSSPVLTDDLEMALDWFFLATSVRRIRESAVKWSSMLIHTSGRIACHQEMRVLVEGSYIQQAKDNFDDFVARLKSLWHAELGRVPTFGNLMPDWSSITEKLKHVLYEAKVITDNSMSFDRLSYKSDEKPYPVIAVGGNTLSRGLVLHGLISTYFLRTSKTYDALLQMGRWFGYRSGYEDLQRIWMPEELQLWFRDLALVEHEIRNQIENLVSGEISPVDLPVLIRMHPKMQITSRARIRGQKSQIGFSGKRIETVVFDRQDEVWLQDNLLAVGRLIRKLKESKLVETASPGTTPVIRNVPVEIVSGFLKDYQFSQNAKIALQEPLLKYIENLNQLENPELLEWDIFFFNPAQGGAQQTLLAPGFEINKVQRSRLNSGIETANIHHLANTFDIKYSIPEEYQNEVAKFIKTKTSSFESWNELRAKCGVGKKGLLGIYIVDKHSKPKANSGNNSRKALDAIEDFAGLAMFFPKSANAKASADYWGPPPFVGEVVDEDTEEWQDPDAEGQDSELIEEDEVSNG